MENYGTLGTMILDLMELTGWSLEKVLGLVATAMLTDFLALGAFISVFLRCGADIADGIIESHKRRREKHEKRKEAKKNKEEYWREIERINKSF